VKNLVPVARLASFAATAVIAFITATPARADDWAPNLTTSALWHSNASNADVTTDQIDSLQFKADVLASQRYPYGRDDSAHLSAHLAAEWWPRYNGLMTGAGGVRAEWRHKWGVNSLAPTFSIEGAADAIAAKETGRRGVSTAITAAVRKRFNDLTRGTLSHEVSWMDARYSTFDRAASETALEIDRDLTDVTRLTFGIRFRDGDIVSYGTSGRAELEALAPNRLEVDTFDRPMTAYRIDARTWSARLAFVRALDQNSAVVAAYEWRDTKRSTLSFVNNIVSVALVHQF
jgi:hypothetical protein